MGRFRLQSDWNYDNISNDSIGRNGSMRFFTKRKATLPPPIGNNAENASFFDLWRCDLRRPQTQEINNHSFNKFREHIRRKCL